MDQCCNVRVDAGLSQAVIVQERQKTIHAAVALAMERVERAVERQLRLAGPSARRSAISRANFRFVDGESLWPQTTPRAEVRLGPEWCELTRFARHDLRFYTANSG
jgi:hypothetical protein